MSARRTFGAGLAGAALLAGCTVGPDYRPPDIPTPPAYGDAAQINAPPASEAQLSAWWTQFNDPELNSLIGRALAGNLDLATAASRIRQSREQEIIAGAPGLPHVGANAAAVRLNSNPHHIPLPAALSGGGSGGGAGGPPPTLSTPTHLNLYSVGFDATWELDVFGGVRRSVEAAHANTEAALWQRRDGEVSLTAEVASEYFTLRAAQTRIALLNDELKSQRDTFGLIQARNRVGFVTRLDVNQQQTQVESTAAQLPDVQAQQRAALHALGVLLGQPPEALDAELSPAAAVPTPPAALPVGLPSDLLRRRPDVRAAERQLAAATANIGVAVADLYPKFNLLGVASLASTKLDTLFNPTSASSVGVGYITWPLFQGGRIRANIASTRAQRVQAYLAYQKAVLTALKDVEDALARCNADRAKLASLQRTLDAAGSSLAIAQAQYRVGLVTFLNVLNGEDAVFKARDQLVQTEAQSAQDQASLFKALGGGWSASA
ncbi:MAG TPA: efflux transporter outer membrane subunit [Caulobacteraceae bacterium]|nr:efflux transporter outer membrane subunit [Caulobacteraceae bacterium]